MAPSKSRKTSNSAAKLKNLNPPLNPQRAGMPALDSITGVDESPKGKYRVIHTNEVDEYDKPPKVRGKKR